MTPLGQFVTCCCLAAAYAASADVAAPSFVSLSALLPGVWDVHVARHSCDEDGTCGATQSYRVSCGAVFISCSCSPRVGVHWRVPRCCRCRDHLTLVVDCGDVSVVVADELHTAGGLGGAGAVGCLGSRLKRPAASGGQVARGVLLVVFVVPHRCVLMVQCQSSEAGLAPVARAHVAVDALEILNFGIREPVTVVAPLYGALVSRVAAVNV